MSERCTATTQSGDRCKLPAQEGGDTCHVHGGRGEEGTHTQAHAKYDPEKVAAAIRKADGNLTQAAEALGSHRNVIRRYCKRHNVCEQARTDERDEGIDMSRETMKELMNPKKYGPDIALKAARYYAKFYDDEAVEKQQHTHDADDETIESLKQTLTGGAF